MVDAVIAAVLMSHLNFVDSSWTFIYKGRSQIQVQHWVVYWIKASGCSSLASHWP